jgi:hypothetical protein
MNGKTTLISGAVLAGLVGATLIAGHFRGSGPAGTISPVVSSAGSGSASDGAGTLAPLPGGDIQTTASSGAVSGTSHDENEHGSRNSSGAPSTQPGHAGSGEKEDD